MRFVAYHSDDVTLVVKDMGGVRDFFKPNLASNTFCQMLKAGNLHKHSSNGIYWKAPEYSTDKLGGSAENYPRVKIWYVYVKKQHLMMAEHTQRNVILLLRTLRRCEECVLSGCC